MRDLATVYRNFDQETLDREYNARDTVPELDPFIGEYARLSAEARENLDCHLDISFGLGVEETLDIFPAGQKSSVFVFIHGGYWRMLSKKESSFMASNFVSQGVATAAVNYTLRPHATLDEIVAEVRRCIAWLYQNGSDYGVDPNRIYVGGSSAGGHLTGVVVADGWQEEFGVPEDVVKGGVMLSGLMDMEPVQLCFVNDWLNADKAMAARNSPQNFIPENGCPLVISYGGLETNEFKRQSEDFATAWRAKGGSADCFETSHCHHFDIPLELCQPESVLAAKVFDMIRQTA